MNETKGSAVPGIVRLDGVTKRYGERLILNRIDLTVGAGETIAVIGPSGGGKSTLLRCINGLLPFDEGRITIGPHVLVASNGEAGRATSDVRAVRRLAGMVFQDFQLFPHLTAIENVIEGALHVLRLPRHEALPRGEALLDRVGLAERADAYPGQLSGGQKQRVAIARALAMAPRILLCDEITSALDPELKHEVLEVVADLKRDGITLMLVTHEIGFARRAADRVVVLADGGVIEEGPPGQVLDAPRHSRTRQFLERVLA
jgi:polar amino acid transport system ATP-binding protein